jgi:hypothetical protein
MVSNHQLPELMPTVDARVTAIKMSCDNAGACLVRRPRGSTEARLIGRWIWRSRGHVVAPEPALLVGGSAVAAPLKIYFLLC